MILTIEQRVRIAIGELFLQNIVAQTELEQVKAQLAAKMGADVQSGEERSEDVASR